ncbi:MAG: YhbY family RNA-binding protein [Myxococcaceae bacterium]|nr:YhbY family RNA-binding protein [Myxococcaceae bacterium]
MTADSNSTDRVIDDRKPRPERPQQGVLTGKQRHKLRALGHHLAVVVQVGQNGVTDTVVEALDEALQRHELVKVQIADERDARRAAAAKLATETKSAIAQELGKTVLFFRKREKKSKFGDL